MPGDVDLILHVGDQIYGDSAFGIGLSVIKNKKFPTKATQDEIS